MIATVNGKSKLEAPVVISPQARQDQLTYTLRELRRRFGDGVIMQLGEAVRLDVEVISTGYPGLDEALGVGGLPRGRVVDIFGPESSGKTTLCLKVIAESQQQGGLCTFIDTEHALDLSYAARCGVRVDELYLAQPNTGEEALEVAEAMVRAGADVVVIDSAAGLVPRAEIEGEMGENHAGLQARLMSQALRKLAGPIGKHNTLLIFTNQLRFKTGVFLGNPETSTGGTLAPERKCRCGPAFLRLGPDRPAPGSSGEIEWRGDRSAHPGYGQEEQGSATVSLRRIRYLV
jgi:recombination protein RecA